MYIWIHPKIITDFSATHPLISFTVLPNTKHFKMFIIWKFDISSALNVIFSTTVILHYSYFKNTLKNEHNFN